MDSTQDDDPLLDAFLAIRPNQGDLCGRSLRDAVRRQLVGAFDEPFRFGRFTVLQRLGAGGMGTVFVAYDPDLDRRVALKVLHNRGERGRSAALREGRALARLRHPNVVSVHEVGVLGGQVFVVMEYVAGDNLRVWARAGRSQAELIARLIEAGRGLQAAHDVGLVHHDFKPENVVIDEAGQARVIDFGLARDVDEGQITEEPGAVAPPSSPVSPSLFGGTPAYMAPERLAHLPGDRRSDQYSFCVSAWELLAGGRPRVDAVPTAAPLPGRIARVLRRGLAAAPEERFESMQALLDALAPAPKSHRWLVLAALVAATALLVHALLPRDEAPPCASPWVLLAMTWSDARADAIGEAFEATGAPFAGDTWASVRPRLDRYAEAWIDAHARACEETAVLGVAPPELYDRRVACLEERHLHLRALLDRFAAADRGAVTRAHEAVDRLPSIDACDRPDMSSWSESDEPAALRERLALREEKARASAELDTGDVAAASERIARLLERVPDGERALLAELHVLAGLADKSASRYRESGDHYLKALRLAVAEDQPIIAAFAALGLAAVRRELHEGDPLNAELVELADAFSRRGEDPTRLRLAVLMSRALGLKGAGRCREALPIFEEHRELALRLGDRAAAAATLTNHGFCQDALGNPVMAVADYRQSIAERTALLGPLHPELATAHNNLAASLMALDDLDGAIAAIERAIVITRDNFGGSHFLIGAALLHLGAIDRHRGFLERALTEYEEALAILTEIFGPSHSHVALARCAEADVLQALGRPEEGLAEAERGAALYVADGGPYECDRLMCDVVRARALHDLDRHAEGLRLLEAALPVLEANTCPPEERVDIHHLLARELWELRGARERARILELLAAGEASEEATAAENARIRAALR
ncbi:MAG: serine/threonine protein kinase [Myxococcales bacterium]|nr:serine/threonine protein kinase [Myxococcales bacterium]